MKWKLLIALAALAAGGAFVAAQQTPPSEQTEEVEDFVPTEKVPAGGAVAFPVDI